MFIDTNEFRAVAAAAQIGTVQVEAAFGAGYWFGRRIARQRYLETLTLLLIHFSAWRTGTLTRLLQPIYNMGFSDGRYGVPHKPKPAPKPRHLRLVSGGGRHAR